MNNKKSFVLYTDYFEHINSLSDAEAGRLFKAIMLYESGKDTPALEGCTAMAFSFIRSQLDRDNEKWEEVRRKRSEAASKRWSMQKDTNECKSIICNANDAVTVNADLTDNVAVNDNVNDTAYVNVNEDVDEDVQNGAEAPCSAASDLLLERTKKLDTSDMSSEMQEVVRKFIERSERFRESMKSGAE
ncbi:MAG: hypothetical protein IKO47_08325 [Ruminococcus sp.]|nr:hypothetical protein [Ruminococcus sp.]